jgi:CO/xanthine dehydrogenase Mo-binding subunit
MSTSRRNFLKTAGCLTIGFCFGGESFTFSSAQGQSSALIPGLPPGLPASLPPALAANPSTAPGGSSAINAWLQVLADGSVKVFSGKLELGQGIRTAIAQVAAEELCMEMDQIEVELAETGSTPDEGYTAGSGSIEGSAMAVRHAAAAAREQLLKMAAQKMDLPLARLTVKKGRISLNNGDRVFTFAEILDGRQLTGEIPSSIVLKPKDSYTLVGKPIPRDDIGRMVRGEPVYVQDLRFPGMVHARVVRPPVYNTRLLHFNEQAVKQKIPGILKIVVDGSFLAVITADEFQAIQAQRLLRENAAWSDSPLPKVSAAGLAGYLSTLPVKTQRVTETGTMPPLTGNNVHKARYFKPYIMHGSIGPSCAIALYGNDQLHVWTHSQGVYPLQETLAMMLHLPAGNIHVKGVPGSGCYGHNGADDAAADAALIALAYPGKHVRVQWMREDEAAWEPYGSAMIMDVEARLDVSGRISHWKYALRSDTHGTRPGGNASNLLPARYLEKPFTERPSGFSGGAYRNATPYYSIPNQLVEAHFFNGPLRTSSLRSLGAYANLLAIESFMDELATAAGKDPFEFRLLHLEDPRAKDVIRRLQSLIKGHDQAPHTGIGIAFSRYENSKSYCAVAARVTVNTTSGTTRVRKMWAVVDAGEAINPDGIKNQVEGGMIQSASWTLQEQVKFDGRHITSRHWYAYPIFRFDQIPEVEVIVLDRPSEPPLGAGETAQGPAAAAIVNAIYHACGKRVRSLPVGAIAKIT